MYRDCSVLASTRPRGVDARRRCARLRFRLCRPHLWGLYGVRRARARRGRLAATPRLKRGRAAVAPGASPPTGTAPPPAITAILVVNQARRRPFLQATGSINKLSVLHAPLSAPRWLFACAGERRAPAVVVRGQPLTHGGADGAACSRRRCVFRRKKSAPNVHIPHLGCPRRPSSTT